MSLAAPCPRQTMYENGSLAQVTGGPLRPGGWSLTERMLAQCDLDAGQRVLDVGCGSGATICYLVENHAVRVVGLDRSEMLLHQGHLRQPDLPLTRSLVNSLPIANEQMDVVLSECSLSAMSDMEGFLAEAWRVLRVGGWLAISDVYVRNADCVAQLRSLPLTCGVRSASTQAKIMQCVQEQGFENLLFEDHSETLKEFSEQIVSTHGSIGAFWSQAEPQADPLDVAIAISKAKLGYFLLRARKTRTSKD